MTVRDGVSGRVSEYIESDRTVSTRPEEYPFVCVTHFPWKDTEVDYERLRSDEYDVEEKEGLPLIPLGEVYEVTVWETRDSIEDTYIADCGVERACQHALQVAEERGIPVWDTIRRLRPEHVLVAGAAFETIPSDESVAVKELELNESETAFLESAFVAVHRATSVASWGETREAALEELERDVEYYDAAKARGERSGEIVETPSMLGGDPRVDGSRIGVLHIVECKGSRGEDVSPTVIAAQFSGVLSVDEVEAALEWAETHSERLAEVRREYAEAMGELQSRGSSRENDSVGE